MALTTRCRELPCHNTDTVTKYWLKLLYKHQATCALLAVQKLIEYDRKVGKDILIGQC